MIQQMQQFRTDDGERKLLLVNGGNVVVGDFVNGSYINVVVPFGGGGNAFDDTVKPELIETAGAVYILDGSNGIAKATELTVTTPAATAGTLPGDATIGCLYHGRLVVSGILGEDAQNYFASRVDDHFDFDYSATDPAAAFAGNNAKAGLIGDRITAMFATTDDNMTFGADKSIWRMIGDIGYGGQIVRVSGQTGIVSNTSWTEDESGVQYFVGTNGFFRMAPGGYPENLSYGKYDAFFSTVNRVNHWVECEWDRERHGCWIFVTTKISGASVHLWYDARHGGFWRQQFPIDHGPICAHMFDGEQPADRVMLLGSRTGYLWRVEDSAIDDGGTLISSKLLIGPITPGGAGREAKLTAFRATLGPKSAALTSSQFGVTAKIRTARDAYSAANGTTLQTVTIGTLTEKYNPTKSLRIAGHEFFIELDGATDVAKQWALDSMALDIRAAGRIR